MWLCRCHTASHLPCGPTSHTMLSCCFATVRWLHCYCTTLCTSVMWHCYRHNVLPLSWCLPPSGGFGSVIQNCSCHARLLLSQCLAFIMLLATVMTLCLGCTAFVFVMHAASVVLCCHLHDTLFFLFAALHLYWALPLSYCTALVTLLLGHAAPRLRCGCKQCMIRKVYISNGYE